MFTFTQGLFKFDFTDHYAILGVSLDAEFAEVRKRYMKLARRLHPDTCPLENETDKELIITLNLGSKQSGKSMPQSMFNDQDPISRENDLKTVGDRCPCTCKKGT